MRKYLESSESDTPKNNMNYDMANHMAPFNSMATNYDSMAQQMAPVNPMQAMASPMQAMANPMQAMASSPMQAIASPMQAMGNHTQVMVNPMDSPILNNMANHMGSREIVPTKNSVNI